MNRPAVPGFGALLVFNIAKALAVEPAPLNEAELFLDCLSAPEAPTTCPLCNTPVWGAEKNGEGDWTWLCADGCNP
jgi:hypothetical protein